MKKTWLVALATVGITALSAVSFAGYKTTNTVTIVGGATSSAYGSTGAARNSADTSQYIGCSVSKSGASVPRLSCTARTSGGISGSCSSTSANLVNAAAATTDDNYLYFTWDATGTCTSLQVGAHSYLVPKQS